MQFQMMREFLALAETLNFLAAAEQLYMSQATLSKHIREMEKELGAALFKRTTRKVELTGLGLRMIPYARQAVALEDAFTKEAEEYAARLKNSLSIGCISHWDVIDLSMLTIDFRRSCPNAHLNITTGESNELLSLLDEDICHLAIVREENIPADDGLTRVLLCEDPLYVFLPKGHPLAGCESLSLSQLKDESFIMGADGSLSCQLAAKACGDAGFQPNVIYRGNGPHVSSYLSHGLALGLMFYNPNKFFQSASDVVHIPLEPKVCANINIVYKESRLTDTGRAFLEFLKQYQL